MTPVASPLPTTDARALELEFAANDVPVGRGELPRLALSPSEAAAVWLVGHDGNSRLEFRRIDFDGRPLDEVESVVSLSGRSSLDEDDEGCTYDASMHHPFAFRAGENWYAGVEWATGRTCADGRGSDPARDRLDVTLVLRRRDARGVWVDVPPSSALSTHLGFADDIRFDPTAGFAVRDMNERSAVRLFDAITPRGTRVDPMGLSASAQGLLVGLSPEGLLIGDRTGRRTYEIARDGTVRATLAGVRSPHACVRVASAWICEAPMSSELVVLSTADPAARAVHIAAPHALYVSPCTGDLALLDAPGNEVDLGYWQLLDGHGRLSRRFPRSQRFDGSGAGTPNGSILVIGSRHVGEIVATVLHVRPATP